MRLHKYGKTGDWATDKRNGHFYVIGRGSIGWNLYKDGDYCSAEGFAETLKEAREVANDLLNNED